DILRLTEWVLAMSTWICHMATKRKEWSQRGLCVGNQNKPVRAYGCMEADKVTLAIKTLAGGLHARCIHGGVNSVYEWVFRVECGWMWGCLRGGQSGDPKAAAASLEKAKGPLNPSLYPAAAMRPRAARLNAFSPRKVYYSPMQTDTGGAPRTEIYLQPGGGAETWTCAITLPGFSVV
ncbi:Proline--tRNA ligase, partial [Dissostichus eleginoides]